jgi:hypothetical protein
VSGTCCDPMHRGMNYLDGKIITHTLDGQVFTLKANPGKEL